MNIKYHNRSPLPKSTLSTLPFTPTYVSFSELLATSDVISLNLALNAYTEHIFSDKEFGQMKDGVVIINTARGKLIDEAALVRALDSGKVGGAGLDVFEAEPTIHEGLLGRTDVVLLPHVGTGTVETQVSFRNLKAIKNQR
jgi:glyoxylate reductase